MNRCVMPVMTRTTSIYLPAAGYRPNRVGHLLWVLWLLSLSDLGFTLWAHFFTPFEELNPAARLLLRHDLVLVLVLFKLSLTFTGTFIFWRLRTFAQAELALWGLVATYVGLTLQWSHYTSSVLTLGLVGL